MLQEDEIERFGLIVEVGEFGYDPDFEKTVVTFKVQVERGIYFSWSLDHEELNTMMTKNKIRTVKELKGISCVVARSQKTLKNRIIDFAPYIWWHSDYYLYYIP